MTEIEQVKRGLTISEAAEYCGVSVSTYRLWERQGLVPGFWPNTRRIDKLALDAALDKMSGRDETVAKLSKFDSWKATQNAV